MKAPRSSPERNEWSENLTPAEAGAVLENRRLARLLAAYESKLVGAARRAGRPGESSGAGLDRSSDQSASRVSTRWAWPLRSGLPLRRP